MMERTLSAPGKLFLSGEYTVLWGGTARVVAVEPRTAALVRTRVDRGVSIHLSDSRLDGDATPLGVRWPQSPPREFHFAARAVDLVLRALGKEGPGFSLAMAPSPLGPNGKKLGMGSSARAVVLAVEAARVAFDARFDTLKLSLLAHFLAQEGKGSGGDVAASFAGGVVRYRRYDLSRLVKATTDGSLLSALSESQPVDLWRMPECRVPLAYAFTGQSASTPVLISQIERTHAPSAREKLVLAADALGQALEDGLSKGDFESAARGMGELQTLLEHLGPVTTEEIDRLLKLAKSYGCAGKISGAGGGDGCIIGCPDVGARTQLLEGFRSRGITALALEVAPGLRGEPRDGTLSTWLGPANA